MLFALHQRPGDDQEFCRQFDFHLQVDTAFQLSSHGHPDNLIGEPARMLVHLVESRDSFVPFVPS